MIVPPLSRLPAHVTIRGAGIAARCCARLLARGGIGTECISAVGSTGPAVLLGDTAQVLLRDCLGKPLEQSRHMPVTRRIVAWGGQDPVVMPHRGVAFAPGALNAVFPPPGSEHTDRTTPPLFAVHGAGPFPQSCLRRFGSRPANAVSVRLLHSEDEDACWIEALDHGWLFMLPTAPGQGWLLGVGAPLDDLCKMSRLLAPRVEVAGQARGPFETAPRLLECLAASGWLACGNEAIAFDPLCGDGTAQAAREAILAAAVITAIAEAPDDHRSMEALLMHYRSMLLASMRRHLRFCGQFYTLGGDSPWWRAQLSALATGFEWCSGQLAGLPQPRYELHGLRLVPRMVPA